MATPAISAASPPRAVVRAWASRSRTEATALTPAMMKIGSPPARWLSLPSTLDDQRRRRARGSARRAPRRRPGTGSRRGRAGADPAGTEIARAQPVEPAAAARRRSPGSRRRTGSRARRRRPSASRRGGWGRARTGRAGRSTSAPVARPLSGAATPTTAPRRSLSVGCRSSSAALIVPIAIPVATPWRMRARRTASRRPGPRRRRPSRRSRSRARSEQRLAAADVVGDRAGEDERDEQRDRVDGEDAGQRHRREVPLRLVDDVERRGRAGGEQHQREDRRRRPRRRPAG